MSMSNYAEYGYGMVLTDKEADDFMERNAIEGDDEYCSDMQDSLNEEGVVYMGCDYEGISVFYLNHESEYPDHAIAFPLRKQPSLFERPYKDIKECADEIKENYDYDFGDIDIKSHIAEYSGSVYC